MPRRPGPGGESQRNRRLIAAGVVVLLAGIAFLAFRDWMAYRRLGGENTDLRQRIAEATRRKEVDLPAARDRLIDLEDEQDQYQYLSRLPDDDRLNDLFDRISEFEEMSELEWLESLTKEPRGSRQRGVKEPYERIQYTYNLRGDFFEFCKFVNLLENMTRFVTVDEFSIKRGRKNKTEAGSKTMCDIKLTFSVYTLRPSSSSASRASGGQHENRGRTARS